MNIKWRLYRLIMKIAHRYNWHYAPPCYPDGDTVLLCHWCGMRDVIRRTNDSCPGLAATDQEEVNERVD